MHFPRHPRSAELGVEAKTHGALRPKAVPRVHAVRRTARKAVAALVSLAVIAAAGLFVLAPTSTALVLTLHARRGPARIEVLYGRVENPAGRPIAHARLAVDRGRHVLAVLVTNDRGVYRRPLRLPRGLYRLVLRIHFDRRYLARAVVVRLMPGRSYRVSARVEQREVFTFLPVSTY